MTHFFHQPFYVILQYFASVNDNYKLFSAFLQYFHVLKCKEFWNENTLDTCIRIRSVSSFVSSFSCDEAVFSWN